MRIDFLHAEAAPRRPRQGDVDDANRADVQETEGLIVVLIIEDVTDDERR